MATSVQGKSLRQDDSAGVAGCPRGLSDRRPLGQSRSDSFRGPAETGTAADERAAREEDHAPRLAVIPPITCGSMPPCPRAGVRLEGRGRPVVVRDRDGEAARRRRALYLALEIDEALSARAE